MRLGWVAAKECRLSEECPAERAMKSRVLVVARGRHREVYLAVKPRVMCLHLNEKEREAGKGRERNTG